MFNRLNNMYETQEIKRKILGKIHGFIRLRKGQL